MKKEEKECGQVVVRKESKYESLLKRRSKREAPDQERAWSEWRPNAWDVQFNDMDMGVSI